MANGVGVKQTNRQRRADAEERIARALCPRPAGPIRPHDEYPCRRCREAAMRVVAHRGAVYDALDVLLEEMGSER